MKASAPVWLRGASILAVACHGGTTEDTPAPPPVAVHCVAPGLGAVDDVVALRGRLTPPPGNLTITRLSL